MKYLPFIFLILYIGCSDNPVNPTNGNPPLSGDSLMWSLDSLVVYRNYFSLETIYAADGYTVDASIQKIKFTFTGETNFDSSKGIQQIAIYLAWQSFNLYEFNGKTAINKNHSITLVPQNSQNYFNYTFYTKIFHSYDNTYKYLKLKNVKIYKIN